MHSTSKLIFCLLGPTLALGVLPETLAQVSGPPPAEDAAATAAAETPLGAYSAQVAVPDQSAASADNGLAQALQAVLFKVCGCSDPAVSTLLSQRRALVQSYGFQSDAATGALVVRADFDPQGVERALRAEGLPVFGVRPGTLEDVLLDVDGIRSPRAYAETLRYFRELPGVRSVQIEQLRDGVARLRVAVEGGAQRLRASGSPSAAVQRGYDGRYRYIATPMGTAPG